MPKYTYYISIYLFLSSPCSANVWHYNPCLPYVCVKAMRTRIFYARCRTIYIFGYSRDNTVMTACCLFSTHQPTGNLHPTQTTSVL